MFGLTIAVILNGLIVIPAVIGFIRFRKLPLYYKFLTILFIIGLFNETWMIVFAFNHKNNLLGVHIGVNLEIILMSLFFIYQFKSPKEKKIIWIAFIGLSTFSTGYSVFGNRELFNSLPMVLASIYFSVLSSYLFYKKAVDPQQDANDSFYIVNGAILFYFSSSFLFFAFANYFITDHKNLLTMANVHTIVLAITNIAYGIGLWVAAKPSYAVG
jgi:hypothetical protein